MADDRPTNRLLALTRDGEPIGWVRSGQVYRVIEPFLARDVRLEHADRRAPGMRLFVSSTRSAMQPYICLATSTVRLPEAITKVLAAACAPEDLVLIEDDGGIILRIAAGELQPRREPILGDWRGEGVSGLTVWCGRCRQRAEHDLAQLIDARGADLEIGELAAAFTEGCPQRRAGQYRRCRPRVERG